MSGFDTGSYLLAKVKFRPLRSSVFQADPCPSRVLERRSGVRVL